MKKIISHILFTLATWYWRIFRPKEYGVKAVLKRGNEILCIKQGWGGKYTFPGGRIDRKETPEEAVMREVKEEVGIYVSNYAYTGSFVSRAFKKYDTVFVYVADFPKDVSIKVDGFEVVEANWFDQKDMPELGPVGKETFLIYEKWLSRNK